MNRVIILENEDDRKELASYYLTLIEFLNLENSYVKGNDISSMLSINRRQWNKMVEDVLHLYVAGVLDKLLIGTRYGFTYTNDNELVNNFIKARTNHFKSQAYNIYAVAKKFYKKDNMTIEELLNS